MGTQPRSWGDCCGNDPNLATQLFFYDILVSSLLDEGGNGRYTGSFTFEPAAESAAPVTGSQLHFVVTTSGALQRYVLPVQPLTLATVRDAQTGQPLADARVTALSIASLAQLESQLTGPDGAFSFDVPTGIYQLEVVREGYQTYRTEKLTVDNDMLAHEIMLTPVVNDATTHIISVDEHGFAPAVLAIEPGSVVEWVNIGLTERTTASAGWASGSLASGESYKLKFETEGVFSYHDTGGLVSTGSIIVAAKEHELPVDSSEVFLPLVTR